MKKEALEGEIISDNNSDSESKSDSQAYKAKDAGIGALLLIFFGLILLFNNLGLLPWEVWNNIWRFWPILIIFWGLKLILGKSLLGNLITTIIGLLIIALILAIILGPQNLNPFIPTPWINYLNFSAYNNFPQ